MKLEGIASDDLPPVLRAQAATYEQSAWIDWVHYIALIDLFGELCGPEGIARSMRATRPHAYTEIRTMYRLFRDLPSFFTFFNARVMPELNPCVSMVLTTDASGTMNLIARINDSLPGSQMFHEGTRTLVEIFPTHCDLPEAAVDVVSMTPRQSEFIVRLPSTQPQEPERSFATLTPRETEILGYVCDGLTNAAIAELLGTSRSTVKNQVSAILGKVDVANRTELAAVASRRTLA